MPRLSDVQRSVFGTFWNLASDFAANGFNTTEFIEQANIHAKGLGETISFQENTALSVIYGYARRMFNAASETQAALDNAVIGPEHMGIPPWARDEAVMNTSPVWHVTHEFTYNNADGEQVTEYKISVFEMRLADTMGELRNDVNEDAIAMAEKYGVEFVSTRIIQILSV